MVLSCCDRPGTRGCRGRSAMHSAFAAARPCTRDNHQASHQQRIGLRFRRRAHREVGQREVDGVVAVVRVDAAPTNRPWAAEKGLADMQAPLQMDAWDCSRLCRAPQGCPGLQSWGMRGPVVSARACRGGPCSPCCPCRRRCPPRLSRRCRRSWAGRSRG